MSYAKKLKVSQVSPQDPLLQSQRLMDQICQTGHIVFDPKCISCKTLQREWYAQIYDSGFRDIENLKGDIIDHQTTLDFQALSETQTQVQFEAKQNYYQWAQAKVDQ